jgi:hypothetical protein
MPRDMNSNFSTDARAAFVSYIGLRKTRSLFSNARDPQRARPHAHRGSVS